MLPSSAKPQLSWLSWFYFQLIQPTTHPPTTHPLWESFFLLSEMEAQALLERQQHWKNCFLSFSKPSLLPSSAQAPAKQNWSELALFLQSATTQPGKFIFQLKLPQFSTKKYTTSTILISEALIQLTKEAAQLNTSSLSRPLRVADWYLVKLAELGTAQPQLISDFFTLFQTLLNLIKLDQT